jgi:hypothetical protein
MNQFNMPVILPKEVVEEVLGKYIQLELLKLPVRVIGSQPTEDSYMFLLQVGEVNRVEQAMQQKKPVLQNTLHPSLSAQKEAAWYQQQEQVPIYNAEQLPDNVQELLRAFANNNEG